MATGSPHGHRAHVLGRRKRPSPDGTLLAYLSDETGIDELYVKRFPLGGERLAVSKTGASPARRSHHRRSLFYFDGRIILAEDVPGAFDVVLVRNGWRPRTADDRLQLPA